MLDIVWDEGRDKGRFFVPFVNYVKGVMRLRMQLGKEEVIADLEILSARTP
jgi:hypothetical protein